MSFFNVEMDAVVLKKGYFSKRANNTSSFLSDRVLFAGLIHRRVVCIKKVKYTTPCIFNRKKNSQSCCQSVRRLKKLLSLRELRILIQIFSIYSICEKIAGASVLLQYLSTHHLLEALKQNCAASIQVLCKENFFSKVPA